MHVRVAGPVSDLEISTNRISGWSNGITFSSGMPTEGACKMTIASNTFFQIGDSGIRCDVPMPKGMKGEVLVRQNLFLKVKDIARGPNGALPGLTVTDNARDATSQDNKGLTLGTGEIVPLCHGDDNDDFPASGGSPTPPRGCGRLHGRRSAVGAARLPPHPLGSDMDPGCELPRTGENMVSRSRKLRACSLILYRQRAMTRIIRSMKGVS